MDNVNTNSDTQAVESESDRKVRLQGIVGALKAEQAEVLAAEKALSEHKASIQAKLAELAAAEVKAVSLGGVLYSIVKREKPVTTYFLKGPGAAKGETLTA